MKRLLLSVFVGLTIGVAALGTTTSCDKIENGRELAELGFLIAECKLQTESDFTAASWAPFAVALNHAVQVFESRAPALETINSAIEQLHTAYHALVRVASPTAVETSIADLTGAGS
jgi:hypothetical protein